MSIKTKNEIKVVKQLRKKLDENNAIITKTDKKFNIKSK